MANLSSIEKNLVDDLFEFKLGHVLDFSHAAFAAFFISDVGVNIYDNAYDLGSRSKGKRLLAFLDRAQPLAVAKALTALWMYREDLRERKMGYESIPNSRLKLSKVIERLGGKVLPPSFDEVVTSDTKSSLSQYRPPVEALQHLEQDFYQLHQLDPIPRGLAFEKFLTKLFDAWKMQARDSFQNTGEQIDGSFSHNGDPYLFEAKWAQKKIGAVILDAFDGKIEKRPTWSRGLFVSYAGFSDQGLTAFKAKNVVLMDGADISQIVSRHISVPEVLDAKIRSSTESNKSFVSVLDLFPR